MSFFDDLLDSATNIVDDALSNFDDLGNSFCENFVGPGVECIRGFTGGEELLDAFSDRQSDAIDELEQFDTDKFVDDLRDKAIGIIFSQITKIKF